MSGRTIWLESGGVFQLLPSRRYRPVFMPWWYNVSCRFCHTLYHTSQLHSCSGQAKQVFAASRDALRREANAKCPIQARCSPDGCNLKCRN